MSEVKEGDFILLHYTCRVKESGEVVETTLEEEAKRAGLRGEGRASGPAFLIVGEGRFPKGLEEGLIGLTPGKPATIEVPPEKGYGQRDPSKIKLIPLRRFKRNGINPAPGMQVEIDRKPALVRAVGAGRVQVDFNHPLSGRTLVYEVKVEKILEDDLEKVKALIRRHIPDVNEEKIKVELADGTLDVELPDETFFVEGIQASKRAIAFDVLKRIEKVNAVRFIERYKREAVGGERKEAGTQGGK